MLQQIDEDAPYSNKNFFLVFNTCIQNFIILSVSSLLSIFLVMIKFMGIFEYMSKIVFLMCLFCMILSSSTIVLFLGSFETGENPGIYKKTLSTHYNIYTKFGSGLATLSLLLFMICFCGSLFYLSSPLASLATFVCTSNLTFLVCNVCSYYIHKK